MTDNCLDRSGISFSDTADMIIFGCARGWFTWRCPHSASDVRCSTFWLQYKGKIPTVGSNYFAIDFSRLQSLASYLHRHIYTNFPDTRNHSEWRKTDTQTAPQMASQTATVPLKLFPQLKRLMEAVILRLLQYLKPQLAMAPSKKLPDPHSTAQQPDPAMLPQPAHQSPGP